MSGKNAKPISADAVVAASAERITVYRAGWRRNRNTIT